MPTDSVLTRPVTYASAIYYGGGIGVYAVYRATLEYDAAGARHVNLIGAERVATIREVDDEWGGYWPHYLRMAQQHGTPEWPAFSFPGWPGDEQEAGT